jgi:hypothetical protein
VREDLPEEVLRAVRTGWLKKVSGGASSTISPSAMKTTGWAARAGQAHLVGRYQHRQALLGQRGYHVEELRPPRSTAHGW